MGSSGFGTSIPVDTQWPNGQGSLPLPPAQSQGQGQPQGPQTPQQKLMLLLKALAQMKQQQGQGQGQGQGQPQAQGSPGVVGGAPPQMTGPGVGQLPLPQATPARQGYESPSMGSEFMNKLNPSGAATYMGIQSVSKLLQNWSSRKDQKEHAEAANIAQNLMNAMANGDQATIHEILNDKNSTKVLNKVYKGWLEKASEAQEPGEPDDPAVAGFEKGIQQYTQKKAQGGAPQGGQQQQQQRPQQQNPSVVGGYRLPMAGPQQQLQNLTTQNQIRQQQAIAQQPASPYTPEQQIAVVKANSEAQIAALGVQKATQEAQKAATEAQAAASKGEAEGAKAKSEAAAAASRAQEAQINLQIAGTKLQIAKSGGKITPQTQAKINGAKSALDIIDNITSGKGDSTTNTLTGIKNSLMIAGLGGLAKQIQEGGATGSRVGRMLGTQKNTPTSLDDLKKIRSQIQTYYDGITKSGTSDSSSGGDVDITVDPADVK